MVAAGQLTVSRLPDATVLVRVSGRWRLCSDLPMADAAGAATDGPPSARRLAFAAGALEAWDSSLLVVIERILERCRQRNVPTDATGLPAGVQKLLALSAAVPRQPPPRPPPREAILARL